jgi:SAM-dependent methyltransferase
MRWLAKAALQGVISALPRSHVVNYVFQTRVTHGLPRAGDEFDDHARTAALHVDARRRYGPGMRVGDVQAYEFGAGWDLIGPLTAFALGLERQTLVDVRDILRLELVNHTLRQLAEHREHLESICGAPLRTIDSRPVRSVGELERRFGIRYLAPRNARATGLPARSFDLVSSTYVLEHVPADDIAAILRESVRLLSPDGVLSSFIDLRDHFMYFDPAVGPHHFLGFGSRSWRWLNPGLQWVNRLRAIDHRRLVENSGLRIVAENPIEPTAEERTVLAGMRLARQFRDRYTLEQLGTKELHLVARPAGPESA